MIVLDSIKICFMDFDDTICLRINREENPNYYSSMITGDWKFYDRSKRAIGKGIPEFIKTCSDEGIRLYCLTWSHSNLCYNAEIGWLNNKFGVGTFNDVIISSSREYKIEIMKHFAKAYGLEPGEILLIDDVVETLDLANEAGFMVASPQEVALIYS